MADEKSGSEDGTAASRIVIQIDDSDDSLSLWNESAGLVGIADDHTSGITLANDRNITRPLLSHGDSTHVLSHSVDIREMRNDSNDMTSVVQSTSTGNVDGSLSSLGVGGGSDARSDNKGTRRTMKAAIPQLTTVNGQKSNISSSNPGSTLGFSGFANSVAGISNLAHNVGTPLSFAWNVGANSSMVQSPAQNMHGWTSNDNVHFVPGFGWNMSARFQVVDSNTGFPVQIMSVARGSGTPQASNVPIGSSHMRYVTRQPPIARPIQRTIRSIKPSTHQSTSESAQAAPSLTPVPEIYPVPLQAQTAATLSPLPRTAAFLQPASQNTTIPSQPQTAHPPSPLAKEIPSLHVSKGKSKIVVPIRPPGARGSGKSAARGSGLASASNASVGPSRKRGATDPPSIAHPGQRRGIIHSSVPASAQTAPPLAHWSQKAPVPPQALTAAAFPSFPQTADYLQTLSQRRALPYPLRTVRPYSQMAREIPHIRTSQDSNRFLQPIRYMCLLCNMDLSLTPEGLILQPGILPNTAVLPCGHHFHDFCLQQITPADQTENPPCIACQKREIEEEGK